ncbi:dihydrodipicolinate synthase [Spiribacter salinus M19-40]|jgi:4-hydroxy-tetrahydrodipicolinate synthase|uniref:4-hydroxy-tetrahydrodipicolinate synthase n=2 Tax=Spiribacter salinus TaxID=1335746 RepID=R4V3F0_9GAMM|nr:4-hydroxy-tetrahydrodipicolinate synthase [Spiribacter salinus]AGM40534.1 dihydrodipicolinate synthase [Spiribacter salinus M19-40]MBY5267763.1 4-hydroxy-tetrahydrodipicolinate synthase [Spiribacter salinus]MDR9413362.1 4-hydroxy-tetrahydrodipicolinate synthase [Spiribacter sp.]TQF00005.1 MAG: 4-hydroxy-tetrahydrodipicolinate synthase [Spiribacter salinus]
MFQGSMVAMVTPMHDNGALDEAALERLVEFHIAAGTDAIVAVGTTGESATLDHAEHQHVMRRVVEIAANRITVMGGCGANSTWEAEQLTRCALDAGCEAALLVTPYYNKPMQEGLYQHFSHLAKAVPMPQILYNVPGRTGCDLLPETVDRLADIPNIVGIKEASGSLERAEEVIERCGDRLDVYCGEDARNLALMNAGAKGCVSVTANVAPALMHQMCMAALEGDQSEAEAVDARLAALHNALFLESNPIPVKWALSEMGLIGAKLRLPLTPLAEQHHETVRQALKLADAL